MGTDDESPSTEVTPKTITQNVAEQSLASTSSADNNLGSQDQSRPNAASSLLTNENVTALPVNGGSQKKEDEGDSSSDVSEISDLSHESWQPVQGPISWVQEQMRKGQSPRKILENLVPKGTIIPEGLDAVMLWRIIINIVSEPPRRKKLDNVNTLDDVLHLLKTCKKIIVLTGAGVSVSCGIPDFRSKDGVYARLAKDFPNLPDPQAMFDIHFFKSDPRPFFKFAKEIYPGQFKPSLCHNFIRLLETKDKLLRNYTQNIDTLEQEAGIEKVVQCHGSFATASCAVCGLKVNSSAIKDDIFKQVIPRCPTCPALNEQAVMKPDIVFFGESLPEHFHNQMSADKEECDLLIVIGSSLKVRPVALIPNSLPAHVPQILINREHLHYLNFDVELLGDCDRIVAELCRRLGEGWDHLASKGPMLDQILMSNLPTPPASPDMLTGGSDKNGGAGVSSRGDDGQVSSSSSASVQDDAVGDVCVKLPKDSAVRDSVELHNTGPASSSKEHHHHHKVTAKLVPPLPSSSGVPVASEESVTSSSGAGDMADANKHDVDEDVNRLVNAGHRKDVVYEPSKQATGSASHHHHHHHHHNHHQASSPSHDKHHHHHHSHLHHSHQASQLASDRPSGASEQPCHSGQDLDHQEQTSSKFSSTVQCSAHSSKSSLSNPESSTASASRKRSSSSLSSTDNFSDVGKTLGASEQEAKRQKLSEVSAESNCSENLQAHSGEVEVNDSACVSSGCGDVAAETEIGANMATSMSQDAVNDPTTSTIDREDSRGSQGDFNDDSDDLQTQWASRPRVSIAERLANNQVLFIPPSRYVFKGAEVFSDDSDSEEDDDEDEEEEAFSSKDNDNVSQRQLSDSSNQMSSTVDSSAVEESSSTGALQASTDSADQLSRDESSSAASMDVDPSLSAAEAVHQVGCSHDSDANTASEEANPSEKAFEASVAGLENVQDKTDCVVTSTEDLS
ncbi:NAD-dependent protein deacetylase sirtuin-1 [Plakobranchus ocellatus]|uniref:protein acetyllysine N-acetyltransferase n=1 Tax=Plakobranchus ocellatus TaxID=259542 RepID=A0AAV4D203_9GAST|nr:NAD-dependent protein deacetylase sirtuin-1 [Plakobranchus ocellatus]